MDRYFLEQLTTIEEKSNLSLGLLEHLKCFCEQNYDKSNELATMLSVVDLALKNQKDIGIMIGNLI